MYTRHFSNVRQMRQHCAITSRFSANHSDSVSHVTSPHNLMVPKKPSFPYVLTESLRLAYVPPELKRKRGETHSKAMYCVLNVIFKFMILANSKCTHQHKPARGPLQSTGTLSSPQPALPRLFVRCQAHLKLCELQATYKLTLLASCRIVVSLLGGAWNSSIAPPSVYRCSNTCTDFENTVFEITSSSYNST